MIQKPKIILGIDPGTIVMGYAVIEAANNQFSIKEIDVLKLSSKLDHYQRLQKIHSRITELVTKFSPQEFAIEAPFFGKNVQSMLKLGRAQGVAIAAAMEKKIPVTEYSPKKVKQSITGNGNADKDQVWRMLQRITSLPDKPKYYDATDALAVAVCHYFGSKLNVVTATKKAKTKNSSWEAFAREHPGRVK
ncbi:MAG: crossover junction endodeoxyribonuclease RuvC [Bacteroidota bacterium]